jgi:hypothetical protein
MVNRNFYAILVAAIIIFMWQFISHTFAGIHSANEQYTDKQDAILAVLNANMTEEGTFFLPTLPKGSTPEQFEAFGKEANGKPWATVSYHKSFSMDMGMNMFRGFVADIVAAALVVLLILSQFSQINIKNSILACLGFGLATYLITSYGTSIWYKTNSIPDLIDAIVGWTLTGTWLGYYLRRDQQ